MCRAASRPSAIAQTTSDWPRRQSPAAKTPGWRSCTGGRSGSRRSRSAPARGPRRGRARARRSRSPAAPARRGRPARSRGSPRTGARRPRRSTGGRGRRAAALTRPAIVADELLGLDLPVALAPFLVRGGDAEDLGPERPGGLRVLVLGRARVVVELEDRAGLLAMAGAQAVGRRVAAADDDHVLARRQDRLAVERGRRSRGGSAGSGTASPARRP